MGRRRSRPRKKNPELQLTGSFDGLTVGDLLTAADRAKQRALLLVELHRNVGEYGGATKERKKLYSGGREVLVETDIAEELQDQFIRAAADEYRVHRAILESRIVGLVHDDNVEDGGKWA